ncbi:hypothetical protein EKG38_16980 [Shewanella canadensis]|uniref:Alpha/beta hydrolase n=1 Tax=Shewanella canadensis TaxID=271096 RepID=A0A3S0IQS6_9GAMM|nr:hypothetical protein [Shewanella canadensis]RTR37712.1 hypothetical protein EKG38_16980 [Shewanella canadensis]
MLKFNQDIRQRIGDMMMQYLIIDTSKPVVVTFAPGCEAIDEKSMDENKPLWGFDFLSKKKINTISFVHIGENNYYQSREFEDFLEELGDELGVFPERIGYGVSRGGFATSLYANSLKLDRALLLMPLSTYDKRVTPWDPKVQKASQNSSLSTLNKDAAICSIPLTIIYDPLFKADRLHVERYSNVINRLKLPGVGHRIPRALQDMGLLKKVVLDFIDNRLDTEAFPELIRERRKLSYYYRSLLSDPTQKLTFKRKLILYYHKLSLQLANIEDEPGRILCRLRQSLFKRKYLVEKCHNQLQHVITERPLALSTAMVFCL